MEFRFLLLLVVGGLVVAVGFSNTTVFGWHADLGISDEQATELSKTNPNDPQIVSWKNALQEEIHRITQVCFEPPSFLPLDEQLKRACDDIVRLVYDNCISHPGSLIACLDPRISEWVEKANSTSPSNSNLTVTDPVSEPSTADNRDLDCSDFDKTNFEVQPGDPFNLDPDGDGIACES